MHQGWIVKFCRNNLLLLIISLITYSCREKALHVTALAVSVVLIVMEFHGSKICFIQPKDFRAFGLTRDIYFLMHQLEIAISDFPIDPIDLPSDMR